VAPALGQLYRRVADDLVAEPAAPGRDRHPERETAVLDLGCGPGDLAAILVARLPGARVIGLDLSPGMVELARRHGGANGRLRFEVGDAARLPFESGSIDLVVSTLSLHHWTEPAAVFSEMRRVLRPGGAALVYDLRLLTVEADAMPEIARRAGLAEGEIRRERLNGGLLAGLFVRYRVDLRPAATDGC
jgi:ubiquinone/menaquinone biosynthesis C-methylase UbiE